ncbi:MULTISPECIES: hypothetical protein [Gilliamella]|uniref:hypothetical protein n=1 Tax=Gilliamella TaxID=1193503 RepID=UPI00080DBEB6|nr:MULTISPECIES: hypothetical protein [Gilliamella]MCO6538232.1 hypothetical protein [Gilliamella sp.]MCO6547716.1 hypothetical protein [Gilliamella sp.]MCO6550984.1 hypothetical protein [Gilliamella sp.]MCO6554714.1 hypothetical protein [Gilliamella sp.]MCO6557578.1 hypothetical protein [Gilliamella sp.]
MKILKKPLFTLVHSNSAIPEHRTLAYLDPTLNYYTDHIDEIIALRVKELKLHHPEYRECPNCDRTNNKKGFSFVFHEIFESEHHKKQIGMLKDEIAITKESNKIKELLDSRIKEIANVYPELQFNFNDMQVLPAKVKEYLFAPPLILTEDHAIMLWDD